MPRKDGQCVGCGKYLHGIRFSAGISNRCDNCAKAHMSKMEGTMKVMNVSALIEQTILRVAEARGRNVKQAVSEMLVGLLGEDTNVEVPQGSDAGVGPIPTVPPAPTHDEEGEGPAGPPQGAAEQMPVTVPAPNPASAPPGGVNPEAAPTDGDDQEFAESTDSWFAEAQAALAKLFEADDSDPSDDDSGDNDSDDDSDDPDDDGDDDSSDEGDTDDDMQESRRADQLPSIEAGIDRKLAKKKKKTEAKTADDYPDDEDGLVYKQGKQQESIEADVQLQTGEEVTFVGEAVDGVSAGATGNIINRIPVPGGSVYQVEFPGMGSVVVPREALQRVGSGVFGA